MYNPFKKKQQKSAEDTFIDNLPVSNDVKHQARGAFQRQVENGYPQTPEGFTQSHQDLQTIKDVSVLGLEGKRKDPNKSSKNYIMGGVKDISGAYAPSGSILKKLYPNEFTLQAFMSDVYWANVKSRRELWVEAYRDSYTLVASSAVPKKQIKLINGVLQDLKVSYYRNKMRDTLLVQGNMVCQNKYNKQGGLLELNPLLMERLQPKFDYDKLVGWLYTKDNKPYFIPYDDADHIFTFSSRSNVLGSPACASIIVDIEAALQAAIYNNNLMQRGGLLSVIIALRDPKNSAIINDKVSLNLADEFTKWLNRTWSGVRGAGGMAFVPMVENVHQLSKISEMDAAWGNMDNSTARKAALLHGVYPERIGVLSSGKSQYSNNQMVSDSMSLSFDNNNFYFQGMIDEYLTKVIIKEGIGIDNVKIEAAGTFSSLSNVAAQFGVSISQLGTDVMTVDTFREDVLHLPPLGGSEGQKYLGEFFRQAVNTDSQNNLNKVLGPGKVLFNDYKEIVANKVRYRAKEIPFL